MDIKEEHAEMALQGLLKWALIKLGQWFFSEENYLDWIKQKDVSSCWPETDTRTTRKQGFLMHSGQNIF